MTIDISFVMSIIMAQRRNLKMDKKEQYSELKEMLETIKSTAESLVNIYNEMNAGEQLQLDDVKSLEKEDVSGKYICVYDDNQVGLFNKQYYCDPEAVVYSNLNKTGIQSLKDDWLKKGDFIVTERMIISNIYKTATCDMTEAIYFDDLRLIMCSTGEIETFERGKASEQEILEVLKYARTYYHLDNVQKQR